MVKQYSSHIKRTFSIAGPCIFENLMISMVIYADAMMVGSLGKTATASIAINNSPMWVLNALPIALSVGGTVLVARNIGAENRSAASNIATQTMGASFIFGTIVSVIMILISGFIPRLMGAEQDILPDAVAYLRIVSFSLAAHFSGLVAAGLLRGSGDTKTPMIISLFTNVISIVGNYFLIYPTRYVDYLPFQVWGADLGVTGAAISTAFAQTLSGIILSLYIFRSSRNLNLNYKDTFKIQNDTMKKVLAIGIPSSLERLSGSLGQVFFHKIVSGLGTAAVAAHYIATTAESISYMPANGFSVASTTLIGHSLGAKNKNDAIIYSKISIIGACAVGALAGLSFYIFSPQMVAIFTPDQEVRDLAANSLRVMSIGQVFSSFAIVSVGIFRGAGDTKFPLIASTVGIWGARLISAYYFAYTLGWGLVGAWLGMAIDFVARTIVFSIRYFRMKWVDVK